MNGGNDGLCLADLYRPDEWCNEREPSINWVTVYEVTRDYGGPEEGGWWFDNYQPLATVPANDEGAEEIKQILTEWFKSYAWGSLSSVNGGAEVRAIAENKREENATKRRPHYE